MQLIEDEKYVKLYTIQRQPKTEELTTPIYSFNYYVNKNDKIHEINLSKIRMNAIPTNLGLYVELGNYLSVMKNYENTTEWYFTIRPNPVLKVEFVRGLFPRFVLKTIMNPYPKDFGFIIYEQFNSEISETLRDKNITKMQEISCVEKTIPNEYMTINPFRALFDFTNGVYTNRSSPLSRDCVLGVKWNGSYGNRTITLKSYYKRIREEETATININLIPV